MAPPFEKRAERRATLVLIDETGFQLAPLLRRTWAPKGETPRITGRARHRDKVSAIAALTVSPSGRHGLRFMTMRNDHFDSAAVARFLLELLRRIRGPVMLLWDRGPMHRGKAVRDVLERFPRLTVHLLPPYAPELNPVEHLWALLKWCRFPNRPFADVDEIEAAVCREVVKLCADRKTLAGFFAASDLPPPRTLAC